MTSDEQDILAEAAKVIDGASERLLSERSEGLGKEFVVLEERMWEQLGKPNGVHSMFSVVFFEEEEAKEAMEQLGVDNERVIKGDNTIDNQPPTSLIGFHHVAEGSDIYEMLESQLLSLHLARDESVVGVLVRMDATQTDASSGKKEDTCITMMLLSDAIYIAARNYGSEDMRVVHNTIHSKDYETGTYKLVDAMLLFFALPKAIYQDKPSLIEALYQDLSAQAEGNNNQQSKEG